jgi:hypothetical protein
MTPFTLKCTNCGAKFPSKLQFPGSSIKLGNIKEQCPVCGSTLNVPNGDFRERKGKIETKVGIEWVEWNPERVIQAIERSPNPAQLAEDLYEALKAYQETGNPATITENSRLGSIREFLNLNKEWITMLIGILAIVIPLFKKDPEGQVINKAEFKTVINNYYYSQLPNQPLDARIKNTRGTASRPKKHKKRKTKGDRPQKIDIKTQPCSCGSGVPFNKCHGKKA